MNDFIKLYIKKYINYLHYFLFYEYLDLVSLYHYKYGKKVMGG